MLVLKIAKDQMKILVREWHSHNFGLLTSISKDESQLQATEKELAEKNQKEDAEDHVEPIGEILEIVIPDDSVFVGMIAKNSVFLHDDELGLIIGQ